MAIKSRHKANAEFSLASMSDLVFLLLIFFMLTSSFIEPAGLKIIYPQGGQSATKATKNHVAMDAEGGYAWNQTVIEGESREEKEAQIYEKIEEVLTDENEDNNVITLRIDKDVTMEHTAKVMTMVAEFGGTVVIATEKER